MGPAVSGNGRWFILYQLMSVALGSIWLMSWEVRHAEAAVSVFWSDLTLSGSKPSPRHGPSMAYDTARGQVVLFGGTGSTGLFQDTWVWDGATQTWTDVTASGAKPSARWGAIMVYDIAQGRMLLFGGWDGTAVRGDTWEWNPVTLTWTDISPASGPSARYFHSMAYDKARRRVVLFGGDDGSAVTFFQDTWEWDGTIWRDVTPAGSPAARHTAGMDYDAARDRLVLFGGRNRYINLNYQDTWAYDDTNEVRQGYWTIEECRDPITNEPCYWHYRYSREQGHCPPGQPCAKLVVFFSTGIQNCDAPKTFTATAGKGKILEAYAVNDTYIAVCANTFLTPEGTDTRPFNEEDNRVNQLMLNIADQTGSSPTPQASFMRALWNGRYLLWSGVSHGATAPVVVMGRRDFDETKEYWKGSLYTAACMYDGVYDMFYADDFWGRNQCPFQHTRQIGHRYYEGEDVFQHACGNGFCACVGYEHSTEIDEDSLVDTPGDGQTPPLPAAADQFAILDWKLIECGSALTTDICRDDRLPKETIQALCTLLDADPARTCTFGQFPMQRHDECADSALGIAACRVWFNNRVEP